MKTLFLLFHGLDLSSGISKKIHYQVKALAQCGADVRLCHYEVTPEGKRQWLIDDEIIVDYGSQFLGKLKKRMCFSHITDYVRCQQIRFVYIRSYHNANPFVLHLVKTLQKTSAKVVMEIPTYPYDQEYISLRAIPNLWIDKCFRTRLAKRLDGIVTFSNEKTIFGGRTIRISNGIDFDSIPLKQHCNDTSQELHLLGVAEVHYWHGFDRIINGLVKYYETNPEYKVYFHIVGPLSGERERQEILPPIQKYGLAPYVTLLGPLHGAALDAQFEWADFGIGSLGRHRSGITHIKTLKNREYAARGLSFVYSETDEDFDSMPYVYKVSADESPIDIARLVAFQRSSTYSPHSIRATVDALSWKAQMRKVLEAIGMDGNQK